MADIQSIATLAPMQLPLTGRRGGRVGVPTGVCAIVADDAFTREVLLKSRWSLDGLYAARCVNVDGKMRKVYLHRLVFMHYHGEIGAGLDVDHIDRNRLNDMPGNLRAITHSENCANQGVRRAGVSGFRGVTPATSRGKWTAQITVNYRHFYLGTFSDVREAALAVNKAFRTHFPGIEPPNKVD